MNKTPHKAVMPAVRFANWSRALESHFGIKAKRWPDDRVEILPDRYTQTTQREFYRSFQAAIDHYAHAIGTEF